MKNLKQLSKKELRKLVKRQKKENARLSEALKNSVNDYLETARDKITLENKLVEQEKLFQMATMLLKTVSVAERVNEKLELFLDQHQQPEPDEFGETDRLFDPDGEELS